MDIYKELEKNPNKKADREFIEAAIKDVELYIIFIEQKFNKTLVGDRADFDKARRDWLNMSVAQVCFAVSYWKKGIFDRYN